MPAVRLFKNQETSHYFTKRFQGKWQNIKLYLGYFSWTW